MHLYRIEAPIFVLVSRAARIVLSDRRFTLAIAVWQPCCTVLCGREVLASTSSWERRLVRYIVAWVLGVPFGLIVIWYVVGHAACGR